MKTNKYIRYTLFASIFGTITSCSDFCDWNNAADDYDVNPVATQTLWENISENQELSDFTKILNRVNMAEELSSPRFYTVWAPLNGTFDVDSVLSCTDEAIKAQFIKHHIADYNHPAKADLNKRVVTLDKKSQPFTIVNGKYTFNDVELALSAQNEPLYNIPSSNGTLHILNGKSNFLPNGMEVLSMLDGIDNIAQYILSNNDTTLDERNSVIGPIINGKQTYLDSVFTVSNTVTSRLRANIEVEDSTYSILLPTDEAYESFYNTVRSLYTYPANDGSMTWQDVKSSENASGYKEMAITTSLLGKEFTFIRDSITKKQIVDNLFYSNNNKYNMHLVNDAAVNYNDTIVNTSSVKYSNGNEIFSPEHIVRHEKLSNGYANIVDTLAFKPWETYNKPINISGTANCRVISYLNSSNVILANENVNTDIYTIPEGEDRVSYCWAEATATGKPEVDFYLDGVQSTTYNVYCVIPPATIDNRDKTTKILPNILNFTYQGYYTNSSGRATYGNLSFLNERYDGVTTVTGGTTKLQNTDFVNDTSKVDTMYLGQITFPYSYDGLGYYPNIKVTSSSRINPLYKDVLNSYTRDIRIIAILLRPLDYEEYINGTNE